MQRGHWGQLLALVQDPVGVGRNSLFGRGVEVVGAWVVLVGGRELDRVFGVAVENEALGLEVVQLKRI